MNEQLRALISAAGAAASARRWEEAEQLWRQVHSLDPENVQALFSLGVHAHQRGDAQTALIFLESARHAAPADPMIPLTIGSVCRAIGDVERERAAITASLVMDPYFLPALLSKAEFLERSGKSNGAAVVYADALRVAPEEESWPAPLRRRLSHARDVASRDTEALYKHLRDRVAEPLDQTSAAQRPRWDEAISILCGRTRAYHSDCNKLHVPRLPALTFHDTAQFAWVERLQARTPEIRAELERLVDGHFDAFSPYIAYKPGDPVNQWKQLNHSRDWSSFHLWSLGKPVEENLRMCPATAEALAEVDSVRIADACPNAMFSALAPHTRIPPHSGETNARLVAHLPLIVPKGCSFRVGFDWREWEEGRVMVFDDSIEHEARNDGDQLRVVLIFDVWNPLLTPEERTLVSGLSEALREYRSSIDP